MAKAPLGMHPLLQAAVDEALRDSVGLFQASTDDARRRAIGRYTALRQKRYAPVFVYGLLALALFVVMAGVFTSGSISGGATVGVLAAVATFFFAHSARSLRLTMDELAAVAPALRLTRVQRAYLDSQIALHALELPQDARTELGAGLDRLVDEEARLLALRGEGVGSAARPEAIATERDRLAARLAAEADPVAREALAHGLATCERRLAAAQALSVAGPRIDAQLEMIAQSAEDVRDGLARLRSVPGEAGARIGMDSVREALEHVQSHAAALESAVAEVRALEARG